MMGGREEEEKYLCIEGEVGKKSVPARQRDDNWEPQMKGESRTGSHRVKFQKLNDGGSDTLKERRTMNWLDKSSRKNSTWR